MASDADINRIEPGLPAQLDLPLLANFVHQVVNPLNGVAGTLDNLFEGVINEARAPQRLKAARAQVEHCITLLRNLAFLAKASTEDASFGAATVVLPQVIIEAAMFYQEEAENRKIRIALQDRSTQNAVTARPELVRQVLINIFDNCVKYSRFGTAVAVDQRIQSSTGDALIEIRSIPQHPISQADQSKIFDLGFRGSNAKLMVASGTGLGLHICKQILDLHGGSLSVQSDNDALLFTIKIPGGLRGEHRGR
jgi:signal transduction histidine kinase